MTIRMIFLDDNDERGNKAVKNFNDLLPEHPTSAIRWTKTAQETIDAILDKEFMCNVLSLDHDLGGEIFVDSSREDCGYEVVRWLADNSDLQSQIDLIVVHSWNIPAAEKMVSDLRKAGYKTYGKPFGL